MAEMIIPSEPVKPLRLCNGGMEPTERGIVTKGGTK